MKKIFALAALAALSLTLTGCSGANIYTDYHELEELELIRTIGVDLKEDKVLTTICSGVGLSGSPPQIYSGEEKALATALNMLQKEPVGKKMFYSHVEHIIVGEEAAKEGISRYLDYVERSPEMRLDTNMFIAKGSMAKDVMTKVVTDKIAAADILYYMREDVDKLGLGKVYSCGNISSSLAKNGSALVMAIELAENMDLSEKSAEKMIKPAGYAVIKDGKLLTFLDTEQSHGVSIITNGMHFDDIEVTLEDGTRVTIGVEGTRAGFTPHFEDGELKSVDFEVEVEATITEVDAMINIEKESVRRAVADTVTEVEKARIESAISASQEMGVDFMDIGSAVELRAPVKFKKMPRSWESIFPYININVKIGTDVLRTYDTINPMNVTGGEKRAAEK